MSHNIIGRGGSVRAECMAIEKTKNAVLELWARQWWYTHYGLTAEQFDRLVEDKRIDPIGSWDFEVVECEYYGEAVRHFKEPKRCVAQPSPFRVGVFCCRPDMWAAIRHGRIMHAHESRTRPVPWG